MQTVADIIERLGGNAEVARRIGRNPSVVSEMKRRNSIPGRYWADLVSFASEKSVRGVTLEKLADIHAVESAA